MILRRRAPIAKVGKRGKRLAPILRDMAREVRKRSRGWCEVRGCREQATDCHHVFGRGGTGAKLGDRWANHPALGADLCRRHHNLVESDAKLDEELKWSAIDRLARTRGWVRSEVVEAHEKPVDLVRELVRAIETLEVDGGRT